MCAEWRTDLFTGLVLRAAYLLIRCSVAFQFILSGKNYFLLAQNNAHSHPMPVQLNTQLPKRTKIISCFPRAVWRAIHAGAKNIPMASNAAIVYFAIIKIWCVVIIGPQKKGGVQFRPPFVTFQVNYIPYFADLSSSSWIRNNWLYFAIRSVRDIEPVLI